MPVRTVRKRGRILFGERIYKADSAIVIKDILTQEDDFASFYTTSANSASVIVQPPFVPKTLLDLTVRNNILSQCIAAMEVNIDGTGFTFEKVDQDTPDNEAEKKQLEAFFKEPFPNESFISIRRNLRFDLEATGNAYLEIIRNVAGEIIFLRWLDTTLMRLIKLDGVVEVEREIERDGKKFKARIQTRERRFCQLVGAKLLYFKEFGASRNLDRNTGRWETEQTKVDPDKFASEVIHFTLERDATTPYGLPRWINQLPSVLGSRKAEEFNLEFFDAGGIPPAVVFLQGGGLVDDVREQLQAYLSGKSSHRVAIVDVQSTSGSLDSSGSVNVRTERFGDASKDAMFQSYDKSCEEHIRTGFRLPPIFIGRSQDYNFATAVTAYMVTEAQVFAPERLEFDETINKLILSDMGAKTYKMVSQPVTLKDTALQMQAITLLWAKVKGEKLFEVVNQMTGLNLEFDKATGEYHDKITNPQAWMEGGPFGPKPPDPIKVAEAQAKIDAKYSPPPTPAPAAKEKAQPQPQPKSRIQTGGKVVPLRKEELLTPEEVLDLAHDWAAAVGLDPSVQLTAPEIEVIRKQVDDLSAEQRIFFDKVLAAKTFVSIKEDAEGLEDIASCCIDKVGTP